MRALWAIARNDLVAWLRSPWSTAGALLPPLGMAALVSLLTISVGRQPVALVVEDTGPEAARMARIFTADKDAYLLHRLSSVEAERALREQRVAAIITIPLGFDEQVGEGVGAVRFVLNNVDVDFSDDLRRTVTRSVAQFDAPQIGGQAAGKEALLLQAFRTLDATDQGGSNQPAAPDVAPAPARLNPYRVEVRERDLRRTSVAFLPYEVIPILILAILNMGMLGTALLCVREFEGRTAKMLLLAPVGRATLIGGKLLGGVLATIAAIGPLVALGAVRHILKPPAGHWVPLLALLLAVTVMAVGLGLVLGVALRQTRLVTMLGINLATLLFFLGGGFTTVAFLPGWLQAISRVLPTSYAIDGLRQALFYPDLLGYGRDMAVLGGCALLSALTGMISLGRGLRRA